MQEKWKAFITWCKKFPEPVPYLALSKPLFESFDRNTSDSTWGGLLTLFWIPVFPLMGLLGFCDVVLIPFIFLQHKYVDFRVYLRDLTKK